MDDYLSFGCFVDTCAQGVAVSPIHARRWPLFSRTCEGEGCCFADTCAEGIAVLSAHGVRGHCFAYTCVYMRGRICGRARLFFHGQDGKRTAKPIPLKLPRSTSSPPFPSSRLRLSMRNPRFRRLTPKSAAPCEREKSPFLPSYSEAPDSV